MGDYNAQGDYLTKKVVSGKTWTNGKRVFKTGASRDSDEGKLDYEGFLSPLALACYAQYMHKHRHLPGGTLRASDNWQKGIPRSAYMKSLWRHLIQVWCWHRIPDICVAEDEGETLESGLCGVIFNAMGYLHEVEKEKQMEGEDGESE